MLLFINSNAKRISVDKHITLENEQILSTDKILVAAGANTTKLLDTIQEINGHLPLILAGVGYATIISQMKDTPITNVIRTTNRSGACGLHILPFRAKIYI